jgi:hypothetical protein
MKHPNLKLLPVALLTAALVAACGGRTDAPPVVAPVSGVPVSGVPEPGDIATNVNSVGSYVNLLIATDENSDPVDISGLTLAADETSDPSPVIFF